MSDVTQYPHQTAEPSPETLAALAGTQPVADHFEIAVEAPGVLAPPLPPVTPGAAARVLLPSADGTPDVEWADLRDPATLRAKDRKAVIGRIDQSQTSGGSAVAITDGVLQLLVLGWSLPLPLPSLRRDSLDELTIPQENALQGHEFCLTAARLIMGKDDPADASQHADPESPTAPSNA